MGTAKRSARKKAVVLPEIDFDAVEVRKRGAEVTKSALDALAAAFHTELPPRYAEFVMRFGASDGVRLIGAPAGPVTLPYLHLYPPERVRDISERNREHFRVDGLWSNAKDFLAEGTDGCVVVLGYTADGDWLGFVSGEPTCILFFPRTGDPILSIGPTFGHALAYFCDPTAKARCDRGTR
jgi:hypothetical protein